MLPTPLIPIPEALLLIPLIMLLLATLPVAPTTPLPATLTTSPPLLCKLRIFPPRVLLKTPAAPEALSLSPSTPMPNPLVAEERPKTATFDTAAFSEVMVEEALMAAALKLPLASRFTMALAVLALVGEVIQLRVSIPLPVTGEFVTEKSEPGADRPTLVTVPPPPPAGVCHVPLPEASEVRTLPTAPPVVSWKPVMLAVP